MSRIPETKTGRLSHADIADNDLRSQASSGANQICVYPNVDTYSHPLMVRDFLNFN